MTFRQKFRGSLLGTVCPQEMKNYIKSMKCKQPQQSSPLFVMALPLFVMALPATCPCI